MSQEIINTIEKNWELFTSLVGRIKNPDAKEALESLTEEVKDRMAAAPASTRTEFVGAYPGGLVEHSLNVLRLSKDLNKTFEAKVSTDSLIITSLFHDIGKIGDQENDHYIEQESQWHRDRGMMYEINPKIDKIPIPQRSLWWLNGSGCPLSAQEISAITSLSNMGQMYSYQLYESPMLSVILQTAVRVACIQGGGKTSVID